MTALEIGTLASGSHATFSKGACALEWVHVLDLHRKKLVAMLTAAEARGRAKGLEEALRKLVEMAKHAAESVGNAHSDRCGRDVVERAEAAYDALDDAVRQLRALAGEGGGG